MAPNHSSSSKTAGTKTTGRTRPDRCWQRFGCGGARPPTPAAPPNSGKPHRSANRTRGRPRRGLNPRGTAPHSAKSPAGSCPDASENPRTHEAARTRRRRADRARRPPRSPRPGPGPARARPVAIARPIPCVEPVTSAVFPLRSRCISVDHSVDHGAASISPPPTRHRSASRPHLDGGGEAEAVRRGRSGGHVGHAQGAAFGALAGTQRRGAGCVTSGSVGSAVHAVWSGGEFGDNGGVATGSAWRRRRVGNANHWVLLATLHR